MNRWLRNKVDGTIYGWDPILARNPKCEEVSEEVAFPEKFLTPSLALRVAQFSEPIPDAEEVADAVAELTTSTVEEDSTPKVGKRGRKKKGVDLHTDDIPEEPPYTNKDLNDEVTRRFG